MTGYNIDAICRFAQARGKQVDDLSEAEKALFEIRPEDGSFVNDSYEARAWDSVHPHDKRQIPYHQNPCVYIVQTARKEDYHGGNDYRPLGMFFSGMDAEAFVASLDVEDGDRDNPLPESGFPQEYLGMGCGRTLIRGRYA